MTESGDTTPAPATRKRTPLLALEPSQDTPTREVNEVQKIRNLFAEFPRREEGQTMAEYGVVLAVITIGCVAVFALLAGGITDALDAVIGRLNPADPTPATP